MIGIVVGVMIGLCLAIMEQGARKAHITTKGWCMDKQPKVKVGDRVRIIRDTGCGQTGKTGEVMGKSPSGYGFEFKTDGASSCYWISRICGDKWELLQPTKEQTMTHNFKVGDRVRVKTNIDWRIGGRGNLGKIIDDHYKIDWPYQVCFDNGGVNCFRGEHLEHLIKTLDNLTEGDVVVDKDDTDDTMTVMHVLKTGLYVMTDNKEEPELYTATNLKNLDYVPQQDPEDDKTWLTVAEVAKKLGLNPDTLHIVADKKAA